jgi:hypothetical protein
VWIPEEVQKLVYRLLRAIDGKAHKFAEMESATQNLPTL